MKIIFLDIDGVLNSEYYAMAYFEQNRISGYGGFFKEEDVCTHENVLWIKKAVDRLKRIVDETGAEIVISSTWRKHFSVEKFKEMFAVYGWNNAPIIDLTPDGRTRLSQAAFREDEILEWLKDKDVSHYVILDDMHEFPEQEDFFVNTSCMEGLMDEDVDKAIKILNNSK